MPELTSIGEPVMPETLTLTPHESVTVRDDAAGALVVEATYAPHGSRPPAHLHPAQDERFEVLDGVLTARVDGQERTLRMDDKLEVPRGVAHQMWNAGDVPARVSWTTTPAGRTLAWFRTLDSLQREGRVGRSGMPGPLAFAALLTEFDDVFRLSVGPATPVARLALGALAPVGRLRGYRPAAA